MTDSWTTSQPGTESPTNQQSLGSFCLLLRNFQTLEDAPRKRYRTLIDPSVITSMPVRTYRPQAWSPERQGPLWRSRVKSHTLVFQCTEVRGVPENWKFKALADSNRKRCLIVFEHPHLTSPGIDPLANRDSPQCISNRFSRHTSFYHHLSPRMPQKTRGLIAQLARPRVSKTPINRWWDDSVLEFARGLECVTPWPLCSINPMKPTPAKLHLLGPFLDHD